MVVSAVVRRFFTQTYTMKPQSGIFSDAAVAWPTDDNDSKLSNIIEKLQYLNPGLGLRCARSTTYDREFSCTMVLSVTS